MNSLIIVYQARTDCFPDILYVFGIDANDKLVLKEWTGHDWKAAVIGSLPANTKSLSKDRDQSRMGSAEL